MTKEYDGDYYFPDFAKTSTVDLGRSEKDDRVNAGNARALLEAFEYRADLKLWEQNYRKHIAVLKPMHEDMLRLRKIINDGGTSKTARAKAERAHRALYNSFWYFMKYGKDLEPENQ